MKHFLTTRVSTTFSHASNDAETCGSPPEMQAIPAYHNLQILTSSMTRARVPHSLGVLAGCWFQGF